MASRRFFSLLLIAVVAVNLTATASAGRSSATSRIVGSYKVVYQIKEPGWNAGSSRDQIFIDTFNSATGAISGTSGAGDGTFWPFVMTGRVTGSTIVMHVADSFGSFGYTNPTGVLTGTLNQDGTISGTFKQSDGTSGVWKMTRLPTVVSVSQSGLSEMFLGHQSTDLTWGIALVNRSRILDAYAVNVQVQFVTPAGRVVPSNEVVSAPLTITLIPAGQTFYIGDNVLGLPGQVPIKSLLVSVTVGATKPTHYGLPPVSNVRVDRAKGVITGTLTNPYAQRLSIYDIRPTFVVYDGKGRIIGGGNLFGSIAEVNGSQWIEPGGHTTVSESLGNAVASGQASGARISVTGNA
jgi:hypothetical protein